MAIEAVAVESATQRHLLRVQRDPPKGTPAVGTLGCREKLRRYMGRLFTVPLFRVDVNGTSDDRLPTRERVLFWLQRDVFKRATVAVRDATPDGLSVPVGHVRHIDYSDDDHGDIAGVDERTVYARIWIAPVEPFRDFDLHGVVVSGAPTVTFLDAKAPDRVGNEVGIVYIARPRYRDDGNDDDDVPIV